MKKILFNCLYIAIAVSSPAQNVGIGTLNPTEKLDVNGNINISGNLKINSVAGQSGQVLTTNEQGQTVWANGSTQYKHVVSFTVGPSWTVPAGVTEYMIEAWGGGGAGSAGGGGASGVYIRYINTNAVPGTNIGITIGQPGLHSPNINGNGGNGGHTIINPGQINLTALGGLGATSTDPGKTNSAFFPGGSGYFSMPSNGGEGSVESYYQIDATHFAKATRYGKGGESGMLNMGGGKGGFYSVNTTTSTSITTVYPTFGSAPGAGGGGGPIGADGASGYVIIWY